MQAPNFSESNHPLVKSLFHHSDGDLLTLFQRYPDEGKYFTAIFCRYSPIVYMLISHACKSPVQAEFLFSRTWQHIFHELRGLDLRQAGDDGSAESVLTLQNWLINMTALCINGVELPAVESIQYSLKLASPPLLCYLQQGLDLLPALSRIVVLMAQTFHWSETRIAAYLQAEGEEIAPSEVQRLLKQGCQQLEAELPSDIRAIYLDQPVGSV